MNRRAFGKMVASIGLAGIIPVSGWAKPITGEDIQLWTVNGHSIFPVIDSGRIHSVVCCFPFARVGREVLVYRYEIPVEFGLVSHPEYEVRIIHDARGLFAQKLRGLDIASTEIRKEGDLMPQAGEFVRFVA